MTVLAGESPIGERSSAEHPSGGRPAAERPAGVVLLSLFFVTAAVVCFAAAILFAQPEDALQGLWHLDPASEGLESLGAWTPLLFFLVGFLCALAAFGLWKRKLWGRRLTIGVLVAGLLGGFADVFFQGDERSLIGLPIAGLMTWYLMSHRAKRGEPSGP